jgi:LPXTG-motif cell wall-anchored protein
MPAPAAATLSMSVAPADVWDTPTVTVAVGVTAVQIPVAALTIPRLPATSTSDESGPPMLLGFLIGLIGVLAIFVWRRSPT